MQNATRRCVCDLPASGLVAFPSIKVRHIDGTQGAGLVAPRWEDWQADARFIDDTGGFGSNWIDNLRRLGREPIGIAFSGRASDPRYDNKRTEMYFAAVDWIRKGGALPPGPASQELIAAPVAFLVMLAAKLATKFIGVYPVTRAHRSAQRESLYTTFLMSTGLTFGTISALFGLSHGVIDRSQYSILVAAVVASAVVRP